MKKLVEFQQLGHLSIINLGNFAASNVFTLSPLAKFKFEETLPEESTSGKIRPICKIIMTVRRKPAFHSYNVNMPLLVIQVMTLSSFCIDREEVADRLQISVTMMLTAIAFKLQISDEIPHLSYLTLIGMLVLATFLFIFVIVIQNAVANTIFNEDQDRICFIICASI